MLTLKQNFLGVNNPTVDLIDNKTSIPLIKKDLGVVVDIEKDLNLKNSSIKNTSTGTSTKAALIAGVFFLVGALCYFDFTIFSGIMK